MRKLVLLQYFVHGSIPSMSLSGNRQVEQWFAGKTITKLSWSLARGRHNSILNWNNDLFWQYNHKTVLISCATLTYYKRYSKVVVPICFNDSYVLTFLNYHPERSFSSLLFPFPKAQIIWKGDRSITFMFKIKTIQKWEESVQNINNEIISLETKIGSSVS